jgi:hypothetical protein
MPVVSVRGTRLAFVTRSPRGHGRLVATTAGLLSELHLVAGVARPGEPIAFHGEHQAQRTIVPIISELALLKRLPT